MATTFESRRGAPKPCGRVGPCAKVCGGPPVLVTVISTDRRDAGGTGIAAIIVSPGMAGSS